MISAHGTLDSEWDAYLNLAKSRPEEFFQNNMLEIVFDSPTVAEYVRKTGRKIGVLYSSPYNTLVVDLVRDAKGNLFPFERLIPTSVGSSAVAVPVCEGRYILLRQFRHAMRSFQYAFPRGFGEDGLSAVENARKELREELHASSLEERVLGKVVANSGISGDQTTIVLCRINGFSTDYGYEAIESTLALTSNEMEQWIASGKITDGYTLAAWALLWANCTREASSGRTLPETI